MRKYISLVLIFTLFIPAISLAHENHDHSQEAQLENSIDTESININVDEFKDTIDGTKETISLFQRALKVGNEVFEIAKRIIDTIDGWLQSAVGISLVELVKMIFTAVVNILEVILDLLRNVIPN